MTVHPRTSCPNRCVYCYVQDLGLDFRDAKPSRLSGEELVFSLVSNPWFLPGRMGTFLAFGSLCDPFHPSCVEKTIDFMVAVAGKLKNPCQFSTKMYLSEKTVERLSKIDGLSLSPLITITSLEKAHLLEPHASPPEKRMESISHLKAAGFKPLLFLRPIIPGVTDQEIDHILRRAKKAGAVGVVFGSLKVSQNILARLEQTGIDLKTTLKEENLSLEGDKLVPIPTIEFKKKAVHTAKERGLIPFLSTCCANAYTAQVPCMSLCWTTHFCTQCPNNCPHKIPDIPKEGIARTIRFLSRREPKRIRLEDQKITVYLPDSRRTKNVRKHGHMLQVAARKRVKIAQVRAFR
ncbi:hypothetical protein GWN63_02315, partial [Candidatus Bathyarchaeota archaeon]|nr:radical SAM protein [Candidatus Bathyarchaeota archaeon]NIU81067.1 hypothetical protein [Candidatus Bathyarchaeota archaeon]NIV68145.1 hypothetical protein [Candidatus Bathyarchaeota archaeon]NIW16518.1 hypothetical protein [Candidatus Bathyarchaeota archaeon]NIW34660.1 hypothetical protein [Candidatus Bathyarchaeota archaeon]